MGGSLFFFFFLKLYGLFFQGADSLIDFIHTLLKSRRAFFPALRIFFRLLHIPGQFLFLMQELLQFSFDTLQAGPVELCFLK